MDEVRGPAEREPVAGARATAPVRRAPVRRAGNRATTLLLQAKLRVGGADDPLEREADRVAREVLAGLDGSAPSVDRRPPVRRATAAGIGSAGGDVDEGTATAIRRARSRGAALDPDVRARMEAGFGADLSAVRVHHDEQADTLSRALQAKAFTTGSDIFFSAGTYRPDTSAGDELLAHELAHTVQQGAAVARSAVIRRVYAGMEYTEGGINRLEHYPGAAPLGPAPARIHLAHVGGQPVSYFAVTPGTIGAQDNNDQWLLAHGRVRLTNDVYSSEWKVEGHEGADLSPADRLAQMTADITSMYALREQLAGETARAATRATAIQHVVMVRGDLAALPTAPAGGIFRPVVGANDGMVQITVQYTNKDTIRRINELNASQYLKGSKGDRATDAKQVTGAGSFGKKTKDFFRTSSFARAHHSVLTALTAASANVEEGGEVVLTAADVGVIKLMVVNDAMAMVMTRHNNPAAQGEEKNLQRFFPKAHRPTYVRAMTEANVSPAAFHELQIQVDYRAAETAQLIWEHTDAAALRADETMRDLAAAAALLAALPPATQRLMDIRHRLGTGGRVTDAEKDDLKTAVLGPAGALLAARIPTVARAYTDPTNASHRGPGHVMNVLGSSGGAGGYTPLAGPPDASGAVYEMRHHEIPMTPTATTAVTEALKALLDGS